MRLWLEQLEGMRQQLKVSIDKCEGLATDAQEEQVLQWKAPLHAAEGRHLTLHRAGVMLQVWPTRTIGVAACRMLSSILSEDLLGMCSLSSQRQ